MLEMRSVKSPSALTVSRRERPSGAAESENGCDAHQRPRARKRQRKNWPGAGVQPVEASPGDVQRHDARSLVDDLGDAQPESERVRDGNEHAADHEERQRGEVEPAPVVGRQSVDHELVAGRDLVEPGERDRRVRRQVHGVPPFVRQPAARDHERAQDDHHEQRGPDRRRDHARIDASSDHRRDLLADRQPVEDRIAPHREEHVREHEIEAGVPVPAVPDREPVEADRPLHPGDAREQHDLEQGGVRAEQPREARDAGEEIARPVDARDVAAVVPEPDDEERVRRDEARDQPAGERTAGAGAGASTSGCARTDGARSCGRRGGGADFRHRVE